MAGQRRSRRRDDRATPLRPLDVYLRAAPEPLHCLAFLLPLILAYEFFSVWLRPGGSGSTELVAASAIEALLGWFGPAGSWAPAVVLVGTLVTWHVLSRRPTRLIAWVPPLMAIEGLVLAVPLLVWSAAASAAPLQAVEPSIGGIGARRLVLVAGAGIYEEFVFRLMLIMLMQFLLADLLRWKARHSTAVAGAVSALVFAACHYRPIGGDEFSLLSFSVRAIAGGYLSLVFLRRGLGVCAAAHVAFNVITLLAAHD